MKVASLFLDIVKAFDCVSHKILRRKLVNAGVRSKALGFIQSFLTGKMQFMSISGNISGSRGVKHGVPQGYSLGLLFFLVHINDLRNTVDGLDFKLPCGENGSETSVGKMTREERKMTSSLQLQQRLRIS